MKSGSFVALFMALVAISFAMDRPSGHTKGTPTGQPTGDLKPGEYWWEPEISPEGPVVVLSSRHRRHQDPRDSADVLRILRAYANQ